MRWTNFKLLSQIKTKWKNNRDFLKLIIALRGGQRDYSHREPKKKKTSYVIGFHNSSLAGQYTPEDPEKRTRVSVL